MDFDRRSFHVHGHLEAIEVRALMYAFLCSSYRQLRCTIVSVTVDCGFSFLGNLCT